MMTKYMSVKCPTNTFNLWPYGWYQTLASHPAPLSILLWKAWYASHVMHTRPSNFMPKVRSLRSRPPDPSHDWSYHPYPWWQWWSPKPSTPWIPQIPPDPSHDWSYCPYPPQQSNLRPHGPLPDWSYCPHPSWQWWSLHSERLWQHFPPTTQRNTP